MSDGAVIASPLKKLQTCKAFSDAYQKRKSKISIMGGKAAAPLPTEKCETETGNNTASVPAKVVDGNVNGSSQSAVAAALLLAQQLQPDTAKNSSVVTKSSTNGTSQANPTAATVVTFPRQDLQIDYEKKPSIEPMMTNHASGLAGSNATAPLAPAKLEIGKVNDTSNFCSNLAYMRALYIKQQEQLVQQCKLESSQQQEEKLLQQCKPGSSQQQQEKLLQQYKQVSSQQQQEKLLQQYKPGSSQQQQEKLLQHYKPGSSQQQQEKLLQQYKPGSSQQQQEKLLQQYKPGSSQQQQQKLYIKGPALSMNDDAPSVEPLGTRCQLCKLDVAFRPQGDAGRDASAPPVIAVLACHHAFHSSCIESVYGFCEPSECLACIESEQCTDH